MWLKSDHDRHSTRKVLLALKEVSCNIERDDPQNLLLPEPSLHH